METALADINFALNHFQRCSPAAENNLDGNEDEEDEDEDEDDDEEEEEERRSAKREIVMKSARKKWPSVPLEKSQSLYASSTIFLQQWKVASM